MKAQKGFTLVELVMVIVILGILAAAFAPKFFDLSSEATAAAKDGAVGAIKSGVPVAAAELKRAPTVSELATRVDGAAAEADSTGINVVIAGTTYEVATYTDAACTPANRTAATTPGTTDVVRCVGALGASD